MADLRLALDAYPAPRLRHSIRPISLNRETLLLLGGRCLVKFAGPQVRAVIVPLLQLLDGRHSLAQIAEQLGPGRVDAALDCLASLAANGLLASGPLDQTQAADRWQEFADRFGATGAVEPTDWDPAKQRDSDDCPVLTAIVEHLQRAAGAGFPVVGDPVCDALERAALRRKADALKPAIDVSGQAGLDRSRLGQVLWPLIGYQDRAGAPAWLCPTAGSLRSVAVLTLRKVPSGWLLEHHDAATGRTAVRVFAMPPIPAPQSESAVSIVLVSALGRLRLRYGSLAARLAAHDVGMALAVLERSCAASGWRAINADFAPEGARALGLTEDESQVFAGAIIQIEPAAGTSLAELQAITSRRSVRTFTDPAAGVLRAFERAGLARLASLPVPGLPALIRLGHSGGAGGPDLGPESSGIPPIVGGPNADRVVLQPDLGLAPTVYLVPPVTPGQSRASWVYAGLVLGVLWLEAGRHGLAGTLCGRVDIAATGGCEPLALCLGSVPA